MKNNDFLNQNSYIRKKSTGKLRKAVAVALLGLTMVGGGVFYSTANAKVNEYAKAYPNYQKTEVERNLDFYGGDARYININKNLFSIGIDKLYTHLDNYGDGAIIIGYEDDISENYRKQFQYTFDYINDVFETVNPDVKLEVADVSKNDSDIFIELANLKNDVGMQVKWDVDPINRSQIVGGIIKVNKNVKLSDTQLRFYMLHEIYHILTGSNDVNEKESPTFSIFNYEDVGFINEMIEHAYLSKEEKYAATDWSMDYPIMSEEDKKSFVTLLPTDLGTLIALYGDSSKEENKDSYIVLMLTTVDKCIEVFGKHQPYFANKGTLENLKASLKNGATPEQNQQSENGLGN